MNKILENKFIQWTLIVLGVISILILVVGSFFNRIGCDPAIILVNMERIAEGYIPYKTLHLNYPPILFYSYASFKWLLHIPYGCYPFYLALHWLYAIGCASCLYYISRKWGANQSISLFVAWLFFIVTHWVQGNEILFEIPSLFWGLFAICLFYKWEESCPAWQIIVGIVACFSFFTKQFGAGFILLLLWLIITSKSTEKWKLIGFYLLGYSIPLLICFACWGTDIYKSILLNGYGTDVMDVYYGIDSSLSTKVLRMLNSILYLSKRILPIIFVAVLLLPIIIKQHFKYRELLLCFFAIGGFSLQFYFVYGGGHYLLYMIPWGILFVPILTSFPSRWYVQYIVIGGIVITTALGVYSAFYNRVWKIYLHNGKSAYTNEWKMVKNVSDIVQDGETVFIPHFGLCPIYYTANLTPPLLAEIGFAMGPMELTVEKTIKCVSQADYVIDFSSKTIEELYQGAESFFYNDSIRTYVHKFHKDTVGKDIVIYHVKRPILIEQ